MWETERAPSFLLVFSFCSVSFFVCWLRTRSNLLMHWKPGCAHFKSHIFYSSEEKKRHTLHINTYARTHKLVVMKLMAHITLSVVYFYTKKKNMLFLCVCVWSFWRWSCVGCFWCCFWHFQWNQIFYFICDFNASKMDGLFSRSHMILRLTWQNLTTIKKKSSVHNSHTNTRNREREKKYIVHAPHRHIW